MDTVASLLSKVLKKRGLDKHAKAGLITIQAEQWLQEHLSNFQRDLKVKCIKDDYLHIVCTTSIAAQELYSVSENLMTYLQRDHSTELEGVRILRK